MTDTRAIKLVMELAKLLLEKELFTPEELTEATGIQFIDIKKESPN